MFNLLFIFHLTLLIMKNVKGHMTALGRELIWLLTHVNFDIDMSAIHCNKLKSLQIDRIIV